MYSLVQLAYLLLYLHILRGGGVLDGERAARELHRSDRDIEKSADRLYPWA